MAFTTSNVRSDKFGSLSVTAGDWTGAVGDAAGSIGVEGGRVYLASFTKQQGTGGPTETPFPVSVSTSGSVTTVSVYYHEAVSTGRFIIIHA